MYNFIDKALIINLESSKDRYSQITKELSRVHFPSEKIERIDAIHKGTIPPRFQKIVTGEAANSDLMVNTFCVLLSNMKALETAMQNEYDCVWLFEDDCLLHPSFEKKFAKYVSGKVPQDAELLYLYHAPEKGDVFIQSAPDGVLLTHSVIIRSSCFQLLYDNLLHAALTYFDDDWSNEKNSSDWVYKNLSDQISTYCTKTLAIQDSDMVSIRTGVPVIRWDFTHESVSEKYGWPLINPKCDYTLEDYPLWAPKFQELIDCGLNKDVGVLLELGAFVGHTTKRVLEFSDTCHVIIVDAWIDTENDIRMQAKKCFLNNCWEYRDRISIFDMDTIKAMKKMEPMGVKPDFIFIDANHSFESCFNELVLADELWPSAIITGHDWPLPSVQKAVSEFCSNRDYTFEVYNSCFRIVRKLLYY